MKLKKIYEDLNTFSAFELQEPWDNSGLLVGDPEAEIKSIVLSIDIDEELIERCENDTLILTHHPLIFSKFKQLDFSKHPAKLLAKMIKKDIAHIAMHTNFDKTHLNRYVLEKVLGYPAKESEQDFILYFDVNKEFGVFAQELKEKLGLETLKCVQTNTYVKTCALTTGSGASLLGEVQADCFITGDIKYHDAMLSHELGISLIDIAHYQSERFFADILQAHLQKSDLSVIISHSKNPFTYLDL